MDALRNRARDLNCDTAALYGRGNRRPVLAEVPDGDLIAAAAAAQSWFDLSLSLGYSSALRGKPLAALKNRIDALNVDVSHFRGRGRNGYAEFAKHEHPFTNIPVPESFRRAAIGVAIKWFSERGYAVSIPVEPTAYDLVVDVGAGELYRVQVKSSTSQSRSVTICRTRWDADTGRPIQVPYGDNDVDYFFVALQDGSSYLLPPHAVGGRTVATMGLRYEAFQL